MISTLNQPVWGQQICSFNVSIKKENGTFSWYYKELVRKPSNTFKLHQTQATASIYDHPIATSALEALVLIPHYKCTNSVTLSPMLTAVTFYHCLHLTQHHNKGRVGKNITTNATGVKASIWPSLPRRSNALTNTKKRSFLSKVITFLSTC